ncbi:MAG TPA: KGG domain-containing protein [Vicinamibacterales bacterium]|nr:KGG domain-containing protein [Vicinamibacterales bacterium]
MSYDWSEPVELARDSLIDAGSYRRTFDTWEVTVFEIRKARRGFASMSAEKQREIASKGGRAAHAKGTAHEWSAEEARRAGRKGGQASRGGRGKLPSVA